MSTLAKRMTGLFSRQSSSEGTGVKSMSSQNVSKHIHSFCNSAVDQDNLVQLTMIVDIFSHDSNAAQDATDTIRVVLSKTDPAKRQKLYNAAMLIGILARNKEGERFTKCIDKAFVAAVRNVLRSHLMQDVATKHVLLETFQEWETLKYRIQAGAKVDEPVRIRAFQWPDEAGIQALLALRNDPSCWAWLPQTQPTPTKPVKQFPEQEELAGRIHEASESAKLLQSIVLATEPGNAANNELLAEFSNRCLLAQTSLQELIDWKDPRPDHETMKTLVTTQSMVTTALIARNQGMVPAAVNGQPRPVNTSTRSGFTPSTSTPVHPVTSIGTNAAARLSDPFDDSNQFESTDQLARRLDSANHVGVNEGSQERQYSRLPDDRHGEASSSSDINTRQRSGRPQQGSKQRAYMF